MEGVILLLILVLGCINKVLVGEDENSGLHGFALQSFTGAFNKLKVKSSCVILGIFRDNCEDKE